MNAERLLELYDRVAEAPNAVSRLRRFVLDLAVRGKLVEQDPRDEPAANLLRRVEDERKRLEKNGEAKPQKKLEPPTDVPFELPESWTWTQLGCLALYIQRGKSPKYANSGGQPVVSQKCVQWTGLDLSVARRITDESLNTYDAIRFLRHNDLLWNSTGTGTIGRVIRVENPPERLVCDSHVTVVRCSVVDAEYVRTWLRSDHVYGNIEGSAAGSTNQVELTARYAHNLPVPLPPLTEQHRIVAKVDELMALCDRLEDTHNTREATRDRLTAASLARLTAPDTDDQTFQSHARFALDTLPALTACPDQINTVRQLILNFAVRGRLVAQNPSEGTAKEVLERIVAEEPKQLSSTCFDDQDGRYDRAPYGIPGQWTWAKFPELGVFGRGKSKHRPRNDSVLFEAGTHPMIQTGDVARSGGRIKRFSYKYNETGLAQSKKWPKGTICITIAANIADSGILNFDACFPDSIVGFLPARRFTHPTYFEYFLRTAKANLLDFAPATAQKNINLKILQSVLVPVPPPGELARIVARAEKLLTLCDQIEISLREANDRRARLLESVLAEALPPMEMELEGG